jgi:serine protease Do
VVDRFVGRDKCDAGAAGRGSQVAPRSSPCCQGDYGSHQDGGYDECGFGDFAAKGDVYTVLTAGHVVSKPQGVFTIKTVDGQMHRAIAGSVRLPESKLDLAVLKFRSSNKYTLVKIGTSNTLEELSPVYVAGYPAESTDNGKVVIEDETFTVTEGKVTGKATKGNEKGYSLIYSNIT